MQQILNNDGLTQGFLNRLRSPWLTLHPTNVTDKFTKQAKILISHTPVFYAVVQPLPNPHEKNKIVASSRNRLILLKLAAFVV